MGRESKDILLRVSLWYKQPNCVYCDRPMYRPEIGRARRPLSSTLEHRTPVSRGGTNTWSNLALACRDCNGLKGDLTEAEFKKIVLYAVANGYRLEKTTRSPFPDWHHYKPLRSHQWFPAVCEELGLQYLCAIGKVRPLDRSRFGNLGPDQANEGGG